MELNNINFVAQQTTALNKTVKKEEAKPEEKQENQVKDNKPAEKQVSGEDVLTFMANKTIDFKVKTKKPVDGTKATEDRVAGYMKDFEAAYNEAAKLGLSEEAILAILDNM